MAAIAQEFGYFFNSNNSDRKYNAESFEEWLKPFFVSGVFTGSLEVTELDTPGMGVKVNSGYANLDGKVARWTSNNTIAVATASGVYDRIDTIVLRRDNTNRQISLDIVTGVAAANPQPTAPTRDSDTFELVLAQIYVGMGDTEITQSDITDTRLDPDLCGYVCAAVQSPDFSDLYDQFTAQFMVWFDHMKDQLDDDAAGHLQLEIDAITAGIGTVPPGKTLQGEIEAVAQIDDDLGIVVRNNKIAKAGVSASEGQYIILRESTIAGCADGLYKAAQAIPANTVIDATYLTAVSGGGLNDLKNKFVNYSAAVNVETDIVSGYTAPSNGYFYYKASPQSNTGFAFSVDIGGFEMGVDCFYDSLAMAAGMYPVRKGDVITRNKFSGVYSWTARFIPIN